MLLVDVVRHAEDRYASREAVICGSYRLTYQTLIQRARRLVSGLHELGCLPGERVAIVADNCHRVIELYLAAAISGLVAVPCNGAGSTDDVRRMLRHCEPRVVLGSDADRRRLCAATEGLPGARVVTWTDDCTETRDQIVTGGGEYEWLIQRHPPAGYTSELTEESLFALLHTTGTAAEPKAVMVSQRMQVETVLAELSVLCFPVGTYVQAGSLLFCSGLGMTFQALLTGGAQVLVRDAHLHPERILATAEAERADGARFLSQLVHVRDVGHYDLRSLRYLIQGGFHLDPTHFRTLIGRFGPILIHGYGCTEAGGVASLTPAEYWHAGTLDEGRLRSCGHPLPGVTVRVVDAAGVTVPPGTPGEVLVRTRALMSGYWRNTEATDCALRDGWLHTRDLGMVDDDGYVFLLGKNEAPSATPTYHALDVETVLCGYWAVADCASFSQRLPSGAVRVVAVVEPHPDTRIDVDDLRAFCRRYLAAHEVPTEVHVVERLPRNPVGKVLRRVLRERYLGETLPEPFPVGPHVEGELSQQSARS